MFHKCTGRLALAVITLGTAVSLAAADEVVHFTNGAEMTIRSHVVANEMLKLDLGGNNSISFPVSMVDKIVSAGQDVFLNPVYYQTNKALAPAAIPIPGSAVADYTSRGGGAPAGLNRQGAAPGKNGVRLGEAADGISDDGNYGSAEVTVGRSPYDDTVTAGRPRFNPLRQLAPGGVATIDPPRPVKLPAPTMMMRGEEPTKAKPTPPSPPQSGEPPASGGADSGNQDPPPSH